VWLNITRGSAIAEGPRDALYQLKSCQRLHNCTKNRILKGLHYSIGHIPLLLVICSKNVSMLHHFWDITNFTVYVNVWDLEKPFSFSKTVEITGYMCFLLTCKHTIVNRCYISRSMPVRKVRKVLNSKSDLQGHSRSLLFVPFDRSHTISYQSSIVTRPYEAMSLLYYQLFLKN